MMYMKKNFLSTVFLISIVLINFNITQTIYTASTISTETVEDNSIASTENTAINNLQIDPTVSNIATGVWGTINWYIDIDGVLHLGAGQGAPTTVASPWSTYSSQINKISFDGHVTLTGTATKLFSGLNKVTQIINLNNFDTSRVTNMAYMFADMNSLENLNISTFKTGNVISMSYMFHNMSSLIDLNLTGLNTSKVTSMRNMFSNVYLLENLDISGFNTNNVGSMNSMFRDMHSLKNLNLSSFTTSKTTNMGSMFAGMVLLENLDISGFETTNLTDMSNALSSTSNLKNIKLGASTILKSNIGLADKSPLRWVAVDSGTEEEPSGTVVGTTAELLVQSTKGISNNYVLKSSVGAGVTVKYQDDLGMEISPDIFMQSAYGDAYVTEEQNITNYTFSEVVGDPTGFFTYESKIIIYKYYQNKPVTAIEYQAQVVNKPAVSEIIGTKPKIITYNGAPSIEKTGFSLFVVSIAFILLLILIIVQLFIKKFN